MTKRYTPFLIALIVAMGLGLRLWGLRWGLPNDNHYFSYHPDETSVLQAAQRINLFSGQLDPGFYNYGSLYIYLVNIAVVAGSLLGLIDLSQSDTASVVRGYADMHLAGRLIAVLLGMATVLLVYRLGKRMYGRRTGMLAALLTSALPIHVMHSHFLAVDVPAAFLVVCSLNYAARMPESQRTRDYLLSGLFAGLAAATKYNAGLVVMAPIAAHLACAKGRLLTRFASGKLAAVVPMLALGFLIGCPGAVLYSQRFVHDFLYEAQHVRTGHGLVFEQTGSGFVYHIIHSLLPGMGLPMLVLAFIGVFYALRRWTPQDMMLIAFIVPYYVLIGAVEVRFARYTMPMLPVLVLLAARIPGKIMDRLDGARGVWNSAARVVVGALVGLIALYTLVYSLSLDNMLAAKDNRDKALAWIHDNIPVGSTIGVPTVPWFYSPPLDPRFGFGRVEDRFAAAEELADYAVAVDPCEEWNARLLKKSAPEYVILSELEYEDRLRIGSRPALDYFSVLEEDYRLRRRFISRPTIFGIRFPLPVGLPHDMSYANPTILIYARKGVIHANG